MTASGGVPAQRDDRGWVLYKYPLPVAENDLYLPRGARLLHVAEQYGQFCLWALANPKAPTEMRHVVVLGTGHAFRGPGRLLHLNTFLVDNSQFVFHAFEVVSG